MQICHSGPRVRNACDRFLAANGFRIEDYAAPTFTVRLCSLAIKPRNNEVRRRAVALHDLHDVLTGYGTDWIGEAEVAAWEVPTGCTSLTVYALNGSAVVIGLCIVPRRVWRAFLLAKGKRTLYRDPSPYDPLLEMTVGELRTRLRIPAQGLASKVPSSQCAIARGGRRCFFPYRNRSRLTYPTNEAERASTFWCLGETCARTGSCQMCHSEKTRAREEIRIEFTQCDFLRAFALARVNFNKFHFSPPK